MCSTDDHSLQVTNHQRNHWSMSVFVPLVCGIQCVWHTNIESMRNKLTSSAWEITHYLGQCGSLVGPALCLPAVHILHSPITALPYKGGHMERATNICCTHGSKSSDIKHWQHDHIGLQCKQTSDNFACARSCSGTHQGGAETDKIINMFDGEPWYD